MDRRTLTAIALCVLFLLFYPQILRWVGLGRYMDPQRRTAVAPADSAGRSSGSSPGGSASRATLGADSSATGGAGSTPAGSAALAGGGARELARLVAPGAQAAPERLIHLETPLYRATLSSRGARLVSITFKRYAAAHKLAGKGHVHRSKSGEYPEDAQVTLAGEPTFGVDLGSGATRLTLARADYAASESLDAAGQIRAVTFTLRDSAGLTVRQTYRARPGDYALDLALEMSGMRPDARLVDYSLTTRSWPLVTETSLQTDERSLRATSLVGDNIHREHAGGLLKGAKSFDGNAVWAAVQTRYFLGAVALVDGPARGVRSTAERRLLDPEDLAVLGPDAKPSQELVTNSLIVGLPTTEHPVHRYLLYIGPSEYFGLSRYHLRLDRAVDMGWGWILPFSALLLRLMNWLFGLVRNYGVAIIALATLVRVVLHPLNMSSMKSMRKMQKLQPEVERIRAKYKNDAQAMNTAVMALYKDNKVNPAGGCLPMVLQMPLLLGLYQVLFNAIELRQAPFVGWISDLSAPDHLLSVAGFPLRLLPVLMAGSGLLQQKLTPTDPRQAPTMYLMNVMMLVFFYSLPSGLVLYWTVMNLLTALQQWLLLREDGATASGAVVVEQAAVGNTGRRRGSQR
jgi:YidC/Oxa1 family membrane protein insertase